MWTGLLFRRKILSVYGTAPSIPQASPSTAGMLTRGSGSLSSSGASGRKETDMITTEIKVDPIQFKQDRKTFLPYMTDSSGRTLYQLYQGGVVVLGDGQKGGGEP